jgi:hypothetical protein
LNNLRILRSSRIYGRLNGGDEMFLFCTYFDPNDIELEFFQFKNDTEIAWRKMVNINRMNLHNNCALIFSTPAYNLSGNFESVFGADQSNNLDQTNGPASKIKVYYRLFRPSTKEYSDKWVFYYCKDDLYEFRMLFGDRVLEESRLFKNIVQSSFNSSPNRALESACTNDTNNDLNSEM